MSISVDHSHSSIYKEGVYLYSWGKNKNGELGNGTMTDCFYPTPVKQLNGKQITLEDVQQLELDTNEAEEKLGNLLNKKSSGLKYPSSSSFTSPDLNISITIEKFCSSTGASYFK